MKKWLPVVLFLGGFAAKGQVRFLINTRFEDTTQYIDLSKKLIWGTNTLPVSCFRPVQKTDRDGFTLPCLTLTDSGRKYYDWHKPGHLKNCNTLDFPFPIVDRNVDSLRIELDVLWDTTTNGGEDGRINIILLHEYPEGGPAFGMIDSVNSFPHPFGRPSYHFRVVPRNPAIGGYRGFLSYGGNNDPDGKLYTQNDAQGNPLWWMPGAVPVSGPYFNTNGWDYPKSPYFPFNGDQIAARKIWKTITWEVGKEKLMVFHRKSSQDSSQNQLAYSVFIPKEENALARLSAHYGISLDSLPILYRWFRFARALRIYGVGVIGTYWGGVRIKAFGPGINTSVLQEKPASSLQIRYYGDSFFLSSGREIQSAEGFDFMGRSLGKLHQEGGKWKHRKSQGICLVRVMFSDGLQELVRVPMAK